MKEFLGLENRLLDVQVGNLIELHSDKVYVCNVSGYVNYFDKERIILSNDNPLNHKDYPFYANTIHKIWQSLLNIFHRPKTYKLDQFIAYEILKKQRYKL